MKWECIELQLLYSGVHRGGGQVHILSDVHGDIAGHPLAHG